MNTAIMARVLHKGNQGRLLQYLKSDKIAHFYTLWGLKYARQKSSVRIAFLEKEVFGYEYEYDARILSTRGEPDSVNVLLRDTKLMQPTFNVEPLHLSRVEEYYELIEPKDQASAKFPSAKIITNAVMRADKETFTPVLGHKVTRLDTTHTESVGALFDAEASRTNELLQGPAYGIYEGNRLVSFASSPNTFEDLSVIRGVYTAGDRRGRSYAASVCSALAKEILEQGRTPFLYVSKDNDSAIRVYEKLGFKRSTHTFLTFSARRKTMN